jgi:hypothetical protein
MKFSKRNISKDQSRDTGMGVVLLLLLLAGFRRREGLLLTAVGLHVLNMMAPQTFRPVAIVWLRISDLLAAAVSTIMLAIAFFAVVTPIGILRRLFGKDSLKLNAFRASKDSVMVERNHVFVGRDLDKPY